LVFFVQLRIAGREDPLIDQAEGDPGSINLTVTTLIRPGSSSTVRRVPTEITSRRSAGVAGDRAVWNSCGSERHVRVSARVVES
jgi:hypothetical protein